MRFSDQVPQWDYTVDSMPDSTFSIADTNDADLGQFFSRPLKIRSFSWATGTSLSESFNPWQDFFENTRVINRITNFNLLRCKLKVRIMLNGNSFHYGRAIASYIPLWSVDDFSLDRPFFIQDVVEASQRPHVYLDPTTSQGGTLTLPFVWYNNALRIPSQDWRDMGTMSIRALQDLKHANGATDQVIVSVFAWAEDVSLSIPTANEPGSLQPQMGEILSPQVKDEYGTGPISKPAGVVARAAGALKNIPTIGSYARATQMAASTVSNVASMFGYSRPVELASIQPYKPTLVGNMANTNVADTSQKLTLDVKQELTIDPKVMGLGNTDEMTILSIAQRESFLTQFGWPVDAASETLLWNTEVSPVLWNTLGTDPVEYHMPACCFATLPFQRWRGSMKFRFQIVASAFHKGRLKITYDPSFPLTNEYNTNYTHIIDLAKERDFTVQVGWGQHKSIMEHRTMGVDPIPYGTDPVASVASVQRNGVLSVYVVNDLTVPNSTTNNDIEVNVFVSAGPDFEVFDPDSSDLEKVTWFRPRDVTFDAQMGETNDHPDADLTLSEDEPMKMEATQMIAPMLDATDHTACVFYGDPITSFRQCLKRYNFHTGISVSAVGNRFLRLRTPDFPYYRGYAPSGVHQTSLPTAGTPYNYCRTTLLNYITPAFTCRRGGLRWKYLRTGAAVTDTTVMAVTRSPGNGYSATQYAMLTVPNSSISQRARQMASIVPHTWDGTVVTSTRQNAVIEAELPYYTADRFYPGKQANITASDGGFRTFHQLTTVFETSDGDFPMIYTYVSTAEDFNLAFFTGAPIAYLVSPFLDPPAQ